MNHQFPTFLVLTLFAANALPQETPRERLREKETRPRATLPVSQKSATDRHALSAIFGDQHIADDALAVHRRAAMMPVEQRYEYLSEWVLPGVDHDTIRVALDFTPTHPAPPVRDEDRLGFERLRFAERSGQSRVQIGGLLVAPAIDLVDAAKELGRLEGLRERIDRAAPDNDLHQRSRLAMLAVVDIAREDFDAALKSMDRLFSLVQAGEQPEFSDSWPEMLVVRTAVRHPETHDVVRDLAYHLVVSHVRSEYPNGNEAWPFQMMALMGMSSYLDLKRANASIERFGSAPALKQWAPANDSTARSRGTGRPPSHWQLRPGRVEDLAPHGRDSLYFQSPLRGNYAVECEAKASSWRDSSLLVAGTWVMPVYDLVSYRLGDIRGERPRSGIAPKRMKSSGWHHLRTVVRDRVSTTYVNGRKIHEEPLPEDHVPWLAIRSFMRQNGITRHVRITGDVVIPDRLRLTATEDLAGWMPYFAESVGSPTSNWRQLGELSEGGGIVGAHKPEYAGSANESLLYYHRPMLEDGEVEYEFYYREGQSHTHPALVLLRLDNSNEFAF
jgi:hypothetical protein